MWASILALCLVNLHLSSALSGEEIAKQLRSSLSPESGIYLPNDTEWQSKVLQPWNQWKAPVFKLSVKPNEQQDVQKVIQYAKKQKIPFFTVGGGHGYSETRSKCKDGIQIDMGNFKSVFVDAEKNTLTIGGSVRFSELAGPVYAAKKSIVVGTCSCVGMAGATLGGGIGFYSGFYGAISDSLISVSMISGSGDIVTASETENSDLLWGMRGAGFNFGAVTSLTYKVYDSPNEGNALNTDMLFPISQNGSVWEVVKGYFENHPKELSIAVGLLFDATAKQVIMVVNTIYVGSLDEGTALLKPLFDLSPLNANSTYLPWKDVPDAALFGGIAQNCLVRPFYVPYTATLHAVDVNKMIRTVNYVNATIPKDSRLQTSLVTFTQYSSWGFEQRPANFSSFPHRTQAIFAQVDGIAKSASDAPTVSSFGSRVRDLLLQDTAPNSLIPASDDASGDEPSNSDNIASAAPPAKRMEPVYTHFAHGDEGPEAWYSPENLPHLRELKKRFDRDGLFRFYNPIS
ncbi:unnamed protein product [Periconia digitata]|uniref:FAD-binding PCMH-type domain-containing protein n=1 Tax=Periconia digitata TaxID=1303443 RepID=A0A9W4XUE1_9PLEO|nr:unnamed protein product [Periconia digitata]